jgi:outer membrane lipoprotein-sorting protein
MINFFAIIILFFYQTENLNLVEKLQNKFESIKYLSADFTQNYNSESTLNGKFYFKKEDNYRIELPNNIIISDGSTIWNNDKKRDRVVISNLDEDPLAFSLNDYIFTYPKKCEAFEEKNNNGYVLNLSAVNSDLNFKIAKLWINENYLIDKIEVVDFNNNSFLLYFKNITVQNVLDNSLFIYQGNPKTKIIDLR